MATPRPGNVGGWAVLTGTRGFAVVANVTSTFNLVCEHADGDVGVGDTSSLYDSVLTAIFTPAP